MWASWLFNRNGSEVRTRDLPANGTLPVEPGRQGLVLCAESGVVMVTQTGDPEDHVLNAGDMLRLPRKGLVVALALAPARLTVKEVPSAACSARSMRREAAAAR